MAKTLVALYGDREIAYGAHRDLRDAGFSDDEMGVTARDESGRLHWMDGSEITQAGDGVLTGRQIEEDSLRSSLRDDGVPEQDAELYLSRVREGETLLLVHASDERADEAALIMDRFRTGVSREGPPATERKAGKEVSVPLAEEEMRVGKRVVSGGGIRVHTRTREIPVRESIRLRQEQVSVERRAVDRPVAPGAEPFEERTIEMEESREEPVVTKETRIGEEVVVHKATEEHEEEVRGTVRRQEADVERRDEPPREQRPEQR